MGKKNKNKQPKDVLIDDIMGDLADLQTATKIPSGQTEGSIDIFAQIPTDDSGESALAAGLDVGGEIVQGAQSEAHRLWNEIGNVENEVAGDSVDMDLEGPEGFSFDMPKAPEDESYDGPSADGNYQSFDEVMSEAPAPKFAPALDANEKTVSLAAASAESPVVPVGDGEKTLAVAGFAHAKLGKPKVDDVDVKVSIGHLRGVAGRSNVMTSLDASLVQAESLKVAQNRILELEKENDRLRSENEELSSAGDIISSRLDEYAAKINKLEIEKSEVEESFQSEILILKGNLQHRDTEIAKSRGKIEELETRLKTDFKKIRVKERELENRLELMRAEKAALVRSKDEYILDLKRKIDQLQSEIDNYREKCLELNKTIDENQEQFKRTVRALRLALSNLEAKDESVVPLKKAD